MNKKAIWNNTISRLFVVMIILIMALAMTTSVFGDGASVWTTDIDGNPKLDFEPGEIVYVHGDGFVPGAQVDITITRPDASQESCNAGSCYYRYLDGLQTADGAGNFVYRYDLNGVTGYYDIEVTDGTNTASFTFTDWRTINWVTVDGGSTTTVSPGDTINAEISVTTGPNAPGSDNDWESTGYTIEGDSEVCVNTPDHTYGATTSTESFTITAPLTPGTYDVSFIAYQDGSNCGGPGCTAYTLTNGIVVEDDSPTCTDIDSDGYGDPGDASCPNGAETDCDDYEPNVYPGATEILQDGVDQNCDGWDSECACDVDCNDHNVCTTDVCNANYQCENNPNTNSCSDGIYCNGDETCSGGSCMAGTPVVCDQYPGPAFCYETGYCIEEDPNKGGFEHCVYNKLPDTTGPVTSDLDVLPPYNNGVFNVTATLTDACSEIKTAEYFLGNDQLTCGPPGSGIPDTGYVVPGTGILPGIVPTNDGSYDLDNLIEYVGANSVFYDNDGSNRICVQSQDTADQWGNCACFNFESDTIPPERVFDFSLNGDSDPDELLVCGDDPTLLVTICDSQSWIQGGEYFLDMWIPPEDLPDTWSGYWLNIFGDQWLDAGDKCAQLIDNVPLQNLTEGTHYINQIRGKDTVENWGKISDQNFEYSFIKDTTDPMTFKELHPMDDVNVSCVCGSPTTLPGDASLTDGCYYVKNGTTVDLWAYDYNPDDDTNGGYNDLPGEYAGNVVSYYRVWYKVNEEDNWTVVDEGNFTGMKTITLTEDSYHLIEYWSVDDCGYEENHHFELDIVDTQAPSTVKEIIGPKWFDNSTGKLYTDGITEFELTCTDSQPHPVGGTDIYFRYRVDGGPWVNDGWTLYETPIVFPEESRHELEYYCVDALGNQEYSTCDEGVEVNCETDYVDHTKPVTNKTYGLPFYTDGTSKWITSQTLITLTADDPDTTGYGCNSGVDYTKYRVTLVDDEYCEGHDFNGDGLPQTPDCLRCEDAQGSGDWQTYNGSSFNVGEESCHLIEYYSVDRVNKTELVKKQCTYVENTPPETTKTVGEPKVLMNKSCNPDTEICDFWITQDTKITLDCDEVGPHPTENITLYWRDYMADAAPEQCEGTPEVDSCEAYDEDQCVFIPGCDWVSGGMPGPQFKGAAIVDPCLSSTAPSQCAWVDSQNLPPFAYDTLTAEGANFLDTGCGNILILSSGNPLDAGNDLTTMMSNPGCGLNPDGFETYDCVQHPGFTPAANSVVVAMSTEWPYYLASEFTDWMQVAGIVDVSIDDWINVSPLLTYGVSGSGSGATTLATISEGSTVALRVADSGDYVLDTMLIVVPLACFEEEPEPLLCGNGVIDQGEECDGTDLNGETCELLGFFGGDLSCNPNTCLFETEECTGEEPEEYHCEGTPEPTCTELEDMWAGKCDETAGCDWVGGEGIPDWTEEPDGFVEIQKNEDCLHVLEWYCEDVLGNTEEIVIEYDNVDTAPPEIQKFVIKENGERVYAEENDTITIVGVQSEGTLKYCAEVNDVKLTGDPGVGVDQVRMRLSTLDDPIEQELVWNNDEQAYCAEWSFENCGRWHFEVWANDSLGNAGEWEDGIEIIIDNVAPLGEVLTPHAGNPYWAGMDFTFYAPAVDFGGTHCSIFPCGGEDCPASGVDYCDVYAIDYNFEGMNQSEIKNCYWDLLTYFEQVLADPYIEYIGRVPYENGVCNGILGISEDTNLTDTVFMAVDWVDKADNHRFGLALNPWFSPITMDMEEKGYLVFDEMFDPPVTSEDELVVIAHLDNETLSADGKVCKAIVEGYDEENNTYFVVSDENTLVWDGSGYTDCYLNPELPGYDDLDSGIYKYTVQYIIKSQIAEEYAFNFIVDNDRPDMGVVSPEEDGAYDTLMPISLYVTDEEAGVAEDSVMVRVYERVSIFGWSWCGVDGCDDSGWMTLTAQDNNLYSMMFNFSEYDINQEGWFTVEAYACDNLYDPCEDSSCNDGLGFLLDTRNTHHCVPIVDGVAEERPECNDGWDNDFDGDIDYDDDIGCENLEDDIETNEELD